MFWMRWRVGMFLPGRLVRRRVGWHTFFQQEENF